MTTSPAVLNPAVYDSTGTEAEVKLRNAIVTLLNSVGWQTYGVVTTTTANNTVANCLPDNETVWCQSRGFDDNRHICFGLRADTTNKRIQMFAAEDLDLAGDVNAAVAGYVNDDASMNPVPDNNSAPSLVDNTDSSTATWVDRTGTDITAFVSATLDAFNARCTYTATTKCQGHLHAGYPIGIQRPPWQQARARIDTISEYTYDIEVTGFASLDPGDSIDLYINGGAVNSRVADTNWAIGAGNDLTAGSIQLDLDGVTGISASVAGPIVTVTLDSTHQTLEILLNVPEGMTITAGTRKRMVLTANINRWLKDGTVFTDEVGTDRELSCPLFQCVIGDPAHTAETGDADDISMTERKEIIASTLQVAGTFPDDFTQFDIETSTGYKICGANARYDDLRGSKNGNGASVTGNGCGDIVSVLTEPTFIYCGSRNDGSAYTLGNTNQKAAILAWQNNGGQLGGQSEAKRMAADIRNRSGTTLLTADSTKATLNDPSITTNRTPPLTGHVVSDTNFPARIPITDNQNEENYGVMQDLRFFPAIAGVPDNAVGVVSGIPTEKYRILSNDGSTGMNTLSVNMGSANLAQDYIVGARGQWG